MTDGSDTVLGIRLRLPSGRKFSVLGGREGLFISDDLPQQPTLLITEGPTDCAALLDMGFATVGRPSCTGGVRLLTDLVVQRRPEGVVIVADADEPGQRGADALAAALVLYCADVRVITPPHGVKDARAWKISGATTGDIERRIRLISPRRLTIAAQVHGRKGVGHGR